MDRINEGVGGMSYEALDDFIWCNDCYGGEMFGFFFHMKRLK